MGFLKILMLLPVLLSLVRSAEGLVEGVKKGDVKKALVMEVLDVILGAMVSYGVLRQGELVAVRDVFSVLVDQVVSWLNDAGVLGKVV